MATPLPEPVLTIVVGTGYLGRRVLESADRGMAIGLSRSADATLETLEIYDLDNGGPSYLGPLPPMPVHQELARCWGGRLPKACMVVPLRLRGRMVGAFYGDRGARSLDDVATEPFESLAHKAEQALERCILHRKTGAHPALRAVVQPLGLE